MAADIGQLGVTVRQWRNRGKIDQKYWPAIIREAAKRGFALTPADFLPELEDVLSDHATADTPAADPASGGDADERTPCDAALDARLGAAA